MSLEGPTEWFEFLQELEAAGIPACIAGGAPRDALLKREVKDVDIWIFNPQVNIFTLSEVLGITVDEYWDSETDSNHPDYEARCLRIYSAYSGDRHYEFMIVDRWSNPQELIRDFDIGLCQIAVKSDQTLAVSPAFMADMLNRTITVTNKTWTQGHLDRVIAKYSDYEVIIPEEYK